LSASPQARRILGLDFSGAIDAGRKIWIAEGRAARGGLEILSCLPAAELPGGAVERDAALPALRRFIAGLGPAIVGCDFPFSLPRALIGATSWTSFIAAFGHANADAFRAHCRGLSPGIEPKRLTDVESKTPWCAFNIRLYRQSHHGMADLLRPLVTAAEAVALPFQPADDGLPWLIETCPASALRHFGWRGSYKGPGLRDQRRRILARLIEAGLLRALPSPLERRVLENAGGDALDSIIAALAAAASLQEIVAGGGDGDLLEGRVYFRLGAGK
jgi:hypothetical protein